MLEQGHSHGIKGAKTGSIAVLLCFGKCQIKTLPSNQLQIALVQEKSFSP